MGEAIAASIPGDATKAHGERPICASPTEEESDASILKAATRLQKARLTYAEHMVEGNAANTQSGATRVH